VIVGAGSDEGLVRKAAAGSQWLRYLGAQFGATKATAFRTADVFLNPGLVGLAILDTFAGGVPMVTTDVPIHSPEIAYLESGKNGLIVPHDEQAFAAAVAGLLHNREQLDAMRREALVSAREYTLENMVANVERGVVSFFESRRVGSIPEGGS
jgi:L-malate glycosyltransferase